MDNFQNGIIEGDNFNICQNCGKVTQLYSEAPSSKTKGIVYVVLGWIFFTVSLLFVPILFGAFALAMGFLTYSERSEVHGVVLMSFAAVV
jgi:hypothetical protein